MENEKFKFSYSKLNITIFVIVIAIIAIVVWFTQNKKKVNIDNPTSQISTEQKSTTNKPTATTQPKPQIAPNSVALAKNIPYLMMFSVKSGAEISGKQIINGTINSGYFFEGNIGVNILDSNNHIIFTTNGKAVTDSTVPQTPVQFAVNIDFTNLPKGQAYIDIHNDNPTGLPESDTPILIPIVIK